MILTIPGHCYSLKNHRPIMRRGRRGKPFLGKSIALKRYQARAVAALKDAWEPFETITAPVGISIELHYCGQAPDALGPAETIFDCLQLAGVVEDDVLLHPLAIRRTHVKSKDYEEATIFLWELKSMGHQWEAHACSPFNAKRRAARPVSEMFAD
jgi:hypothetical protein